MFDDATKPSHVLPERERGEFDECEGRARTLSDGECHVMFHLSLRQEPVSPCAAEEVLKRLDSGD